MRVRLPAALVATLALGATATGAPLTRDQLIKAARGGQSIQAIMAQSFPQSRIQRQSGARVRVLLSVMPRMVITGKTALAVTDEGQWKHPVQRPLEANHRYEITRSGSGFSVRDLDGTGAPRTFKGPIRVDSADAATGIRIADPFDRRYRGSLRMVALDKDSFQLVNELGLEDYLQGVLPGEVPEDTGPATALKAEVIAYRSRTFARLRGRGFPYDVDSDTPLYLGFDAERGPTNQAVRGSKGLTLMVGKRPFEAAFPTSGTVIAPTLTADFGRPEQIASAPSKLISGASPGLGSAAADAALGFLGTPYVWGGTSPSGFDCSGYTNYIYGKLGILLPRVAEDQAKVGQYVPKDQLQRGDAVFFADSSGYIHHMGLYLDGTRFIHSPKTGDVVKISDFGSGYYASQYAGARRYSPVVGTIPGK